MKNIFLTFILLFVTNTFAVELTPPPAKNFHSLSQWSERMVLKIPQGSEFHLQSDTRLTLDELVIDGIIVTNGFQFQVDTFRLTFGENGKILAFTTPAKQGVTGDKGADGKTSTAEGGRGGDADDGKIGGDGVDGVQNPGAILIHAVEIVGLPNIDGTGQEGGSGGEGGPGGRGGQGGKGTAAYSNCAGKRRHGGSGGSGGQGGKGGPGGQGGRGGREVPVIFIAGYNNDLNLSNIQSKPGLRGDLGLHGKPGGRGPGGAGGEPASKSCAWGTYTVSADRGSNGSEGPEQKEHLGNGKHGEEAHPLDKNNTYLKLFSAQSSPLNFSMLDFDKERLDVAQRWFYFHWARSFYILFSETLSQIQDENPNLSLENSKDEILDSLLGSISKERIQILINAWQEHFVSPVKSINGLDEGGLKEISLQAAEKILNLLTILSKEDVLSKRDELGQLLTSIKDKVDLQMTTALDSSLLACKQYVLNLKKKKFTATEISLYYTIPVCLGEPDFGVASNFDKEIPLFVTRTPELPLDWQNFVEQVAFHKLEMQSPKRNISILNWFIPSAFAYSFVVEGDESNVETIEELQKAVPQRKWLVDGRGILKGFPKIKSELTVNEIQSSLVRLGRSLEVLTQNEGTTK